MIKRFDSTQKINLAIISGKRILKNVEKRQHKIKQTNYRGRNENIDKFF